MADPRIVRLLELEDEIMGDLDTVQQDRCCGSKEHEEMNSYQAEVRRGFDGIRDMLEIKGE